MNITAEVMAGFDVLEDPAEMITEILTDPAAALQIIANVGMDMSDEEREESEKVIVAAVIVSNIAVNAAVSAAQAALAVGGGAPVSGGGSRGPRRRIK